jgi:cytochrome c5
MMKSILAILLTSLILILGACSSVAPQATPVLPTATVAVTSTVFPSETATAAPLSEDDRELVETYCTGCHTIDVVTSAHKTHEQWAEIITHKVTL